MRAKTQLKPAKKQIDAAEAAKKQAEACKIIAAAGLRSKVVFNQSGKRLIFFCTLERAEFKLDNVMFSNEGCIEGEAYRWPTLSELDDQLYECFAVFLRDDCVINENVAAAFIAMYSNFTKNILKS